MAHGKKRAAAPVPVGTSKGWSADLNRPQWRMDHLFYGIKLHDHVSLKVLLSCGCRCLLS